MVAEPLCSAERSSEIFNGKDSRKKQENHGKPCFYLGNSCFMSFPSVFSWSFFLWDIENLYKLGSIQFTFQPRSVCSLFQMFFHYLASFHYETKQSWVMGMPLKATNHATTPGPPLCQVWKQCLMKPIRGSRPKVPFFQSHQETPGT